MDSEAKWNDPVAHLRQALAEDAFTLLLPAHRRPRRAINLSHGRGAGQAARRRESATPAGEFLPVLEHYGMMPELDRWVVRHVLQRLSKGSLMPRFAVNLSTQTLADRAFPAFFADELLAAGVAGDCLLFEIDESDALALPDCTARFTATVGSLGAGVVSMASGARPIACNRSRRPACSS